MGEILWLGALLGGGAALSVGPIFVTILQEAATRGFGASLRVILGSAIADLILLAPALAFAGLIAVLAGARMWIGLGGAVFLLFLAGQAFRESRRLWREGVPVPAGGWAFGKGVIGNLANPLTWTFWLATGTPAILRVQRLGGGGGLLLFIMTWFVMAAVIESTLAFAVARSGRRLGARGQAVFTALSAVLFVVLAGTLLARDVATSLLDS